MQGRCNLHDQFLVLIECGTEEEQTNLLQRFMEEGLKCRRAHRITMRRVRLLFPRSAWERLFAALREPDPRTWQLMHDFLAAMNM